MTSRERLLPKISRKITTTVNAIPFQGKIDVTQATKDALREPDVYVKEKRLENATALLGQYSIIHSIEAFMGAQVLYSLTTSNNLLHRPIDTGISLAFTLANAAVAYTQASLAVKMQRKEDEHQGRIEAYEEIHGKPTKQTLREAKRRAAKKFDPEHPYFSRKFVLLSYAAGYAAVGAFLLTYNNNIHYGVPSFLK